MTAPVGLSVPEGTFVLFDAGFVTAIVTLVKAALAIICRETAV